MTCPALRRHCLSTQSLQSTAVGGGQKGPLQPSCMHWPSSKKKEHASVPKVSIAIGTKWCVADSLACASLALEHTILNYQPENMGKHADVLTVMHLSSSGRRYPVTGVRHSYGYTLHHSLLPEFVGFVGDPSAGVQLVLPSCLLRVATQHPGRSSPVSLLRRSSTGVMLMWIASLSNSSLGCLAKSTTVVSFHLMVCWSFHAGSATADFSSVPFLQASWCSLKLVSNFLLVSLM